MTSLPDAVVAFIHRTTVSQRRPAYLRLDRGGLLVEAGGELALYGLGELEPTRSVSRQLPVLDGLLPLSDDSLQLECIQHGDGPPYDLYLFRSGDDHWVLVLDATAEFVRRREVQQKTAELSLLRDKQARLLDQYLGPVVAEELARVENLAPGGGGRVELTTLFADIRGFTAFSEQYPPELVFRVLNRYLETVLPLVRDGAGVVDKMVGDAVMAVFGVLSSTGAPPVQAVRSALRILEGGRQLGAALEAEGLPPLEFGVGVATGSVILGVMGNRQRRTISVVGPSVNLASRLESRARGGEVLIDALTWSRLGELRGRFERRRLTLDGFRDPVEAYALPLGRSGFLGGVSR